LVNQKILERRLSKLGYIVVVCDNGNECVEIFSQNPAEFDFILMDVQVKFKII
jgi:CheY-like chemotaxis protein